VPDDTLRAAMRAVLLRAKELVTLLAEHLDVTCEALARGDASNLDTYLGHELALLGKLDETFRQQHELLLRQGLTADRHGLETAIRRCADRELDALWLALRQQLEDCRERNRSNARLAKQSSLRAQAALQILRGEDVEATGYGPRGDPQSSTGGHTIARV
jgi:flagellar biosynthesis/type III secretory pathway chaperone